jgi:hypothetical protein
MGEIFSANGGSDEGKGDKLAVVCERLDMNEEQLNRLQKANGTKTARSIVRACFPPSVRMGIGLDDIESDFRQAIHGEILFFNLMPKTCLYFRLCTNISWDGRSERG